MTYGCGKSDSAILAGKPTNKAEQSAAESVERRVEAKGNTGQQSTYRAQDRESVVTGAGPHTASGKAQEEGEVHRALPPYHRPAAPGGVLRTQGECRSRSGRAEMGENTRRISNTGSKICTHDSSGERIGRCRAGEGTYPSRTGSYARSRLPP